MDDVADEEVLVGGHDAGPVIRVGGTVRRLARPWTPSVHALLRHLDAVGFRGAPRVLGIDEQGREALTYIVGRDGRVARCYDDQALIEVAEMIRGFHDAIASFTPPPDSHWRPDPRAPRGALLCHNDLSPANTIFLDGHPRAFIDWDHATPSTALWDLSYAVRTFVPLYSAEDCNKMGYPPDQQSHRLSLFCEAYGMDAGTRVDLLPMVRARLETEQSAFALRCRHTVLAQWSNWLRAVTT